MSVSHLFVFGKMPAQVLYSFIKEKDLCIYFWPRWVFITACRLLQLGSGGCLSCGVQASRCGGFACCRAQSRACAFSSCGSRALERWLSGCGARAQLLCSVWDPPGSLALAGGLLPTEPPGKLLQWVFTEGLGGAQKFSPQSWRSRLEKNISAVGKQQQGTPLVSQTLPPPLKA